MRVEEVGACKVESGPLDLLAQDSDDALPFSFSPQNPVAALSCLG